MSWTTALAFAFVGVLASLEPGESRAHVSKDLQAQAPARDPRPGEPRAASSRETELVGLTKRDPSNSAGWLELAKLQEERGADEDAEQTLTAALAATGRETGVLLAVSGFYNRRGDFEKCIAPLEEIAAKQPNDAQAQQFLAPYYYDKASKDLRLPASERERYADLGIAATNRALAAKEDYSDALVYKNLLLRVKAGLDGNAAVRDGLIAEADALRNRAIQLRQTQQPTTPPANLHAPAPPPPPPAPPAAPVLIDGVQPVRVGGNVKVPTKIHDERPVYPEEALRARVSGMVILEAVIDTSGTVRSAKVLRSIPLLDAAAVEAVKGWRFDPATLGVPVVMTVTVNFTMQ